MEHSAQWWPLADFTPERRGRGRDQAPLEKRQPPPAAPSPARWGTGSNTETRTAKRCGQSRGSDQRAWTFPPPGPQASRHSLPGRVTDPQEKTPDYYTQKRLRSPQSLKTPTAQQERRNRTGEHTHAHTHACTLTESFRGGVPWLTDSQHTPHQTKAKAPMSHSRPRHMAPVCLRSTHS